MHKVIEQTSEHTSVAPQRNINKSIINRLIIKIKEAFDKLDTKVPIDRIEELAILVYGVMHGGRRNFHSAEHVFHICKDMKPLQVLAGLFHDIIYYQVDDGFPSSLEARILEFAEVREDKGVFIRKLSRKDLIFEICLEIFDFSEGQQLSVFGGLNEFLSTLIALKKLGDFLSLKQLITIAVCIEATIPFRKTDENGRSPYDNLERRLKTISQKYHIPFTDDEVRKIITSAVILANRDVENFSYDDSAIFLDNTWALLPETNDSLSSVYTISDYRMAMMKMEAFMSFINPENVFHQYRSTPNNQQFVRLQKNAKKNIIVGRRYLGIKLLTIAIVEALAIVTGGDVPIAMFLGDKTKTGQSQMTEKAEDFLPNVEERTNISYDPVLRKLLQIGRNIEPDFDLKHSPFATFIYTIIGNEGIAEYLAYAKQMFRGEVTAEYFLFKNNPEVVKGMANACAKIAITRKELLIEKIIKKL